MVHIFFGMLGDSGARLLQHLLAFAKAQRIRRTSFHAGRHNDVFLMLLDLRLSKSYSIALKRSRLGGAVSTVGAFLNLGGMRIPLSRRHTPRTCPHTVAATDAFVRIVTHRAVKLGRQSSCRTRRSASRFQAVQAAPHSKEIIQSTWRRFVWELMKRDQR